MHDFQRRVHRTSFGCIRIRFLGICLSIPIAVCLWLDRNSYLKKKSSWVTWMSIKLGKFGKRWDKGDEEKSENINRGSNRWEGTCHIYKQAGKELSRERGSKLQITTQMKVAYFHHYCCLCCDHKYINVWLRLLMQSGEMGAEKQMQSTCLSRADIDSRHCLQSILGGTWVK